MYLSLYLCIYLYIYISIYLPVCLYIYIYIYPSIHLPICLHIYMSVCLYIYLSNHLSMYLSMYLSICLYIYVPIYLCIYLSILLKNRGSTVGMANGYRLYNRRFGVRIPVRLQISLFHMFRTNLGPTQPRHLQLVSRSRKRKSTHLLPLSPHGVGLH
jgi:hypothetical protein